jgi:serine/threonine-protein kinase
VRAQPSAPKIAVAPAPAPEIPRPTTDPAPTLETDKTPALQLPPQPTSGGTPASPAAGAVSGEVALTKHCSVCEARYPADFLLCPRDAMPLVDDAAQKEDPLLGTMLGETYQIVRVVGEGGMGRVYEARHLRLKDRRFAVKVLHPELARQAEVVQRFQHEAENASAIGHENVADVYDVHRTIDGRPYLIGEFLEGIELGEQLAKLGKLDIPEAVRIARQVCRALGAAHSKGIVHRDMKPENVFLAQADGVPVVKVLDFGISKLGEGKTHLTRTGMIMGTPSYMAPEQARGDSVDLRVDVYAVGALLYQLVTGKRPFDSDDPAAIITMVLTQDPPRPRQLEPRLPEGLEVAIQRAMAKDARERYQSMAELDVALAPFDTETSASLGTVRLARPVTAGQAFKLAGSLESAQTMMAGLSPSLPPSEGQAKLARPTIIALSLVTGGWLSFGIVDALAGIVRFSHAGELTVTEGILLVVGIVLAALTPAALFVQRVRKNVWQNSVKSLELASDLKRIVGTALIAYGAGAFASRVVFTVLMRDSHKLAGGMWDLGLFLLSLVGAAIGGGLGPIARRIRRRKHA